MRRINQDSRPERVSNGEYFFAKNVILNEKEGSVQPEEGFLEKLDFTGKTLKGYIKFEDLIILFFTTTSSHEIGVYNEITNSYSIKVADPDLNFSDQPIQGEAYRNSKKEVIIAFWDGVEASSTYPKLINIDNPPATVTSDNIRLFLNAKTPYISSIEAITGGSLISGAYQFAYAYKDVEGNQTGWLFIDKPFYIVRDQSSISYRNYQGAPPNTPTGKAISFTLSNIDTDFNKIVISAIKRIGNSISVQVIKEEFIGASTIKSFTYGGNENPIFESLEAVSVRPTSYAKIGAGTQLDSRLILGNVEVDESVNWQKYANLVQVNSSYVQKSLELLPSSHKTEELKGFQFGEVYAFYIAFKLKSGAWTRAFHIPGRAAVDIDETWNTLSKKENNLLDDTAGGNSIIGLASGWNIAEDNKLGDEVRWYQTRDSAYNSNASNNLGYWENQNEVYPSTVDYDSSGIGGTDLRGEKVRHHKMPTIHEMKNENFNADVDFWKNKSVRLTIDVSNIQIDADLASKVDYYAVFYAKRDYNNSLIVGQSTFHFGHSAGTTTVAGLSSGDRVAGGGNWTVADRTTANSGFSVDKTTVRFHDFALLRNKPSISPSFVKNEMHLSATSLTNYTDDELTSGLKGNAADTRYMFINYTDNTNIAVSAASNADRIRKISNGKFLEANTIIGEDYNRNGESCYIADIENGATLSLSINAIELDPPSSTPAECHSYITSLCNYRENLYIGFESRELVMTSRINNINGAATYSTTFLYGGDVFQSQHSIMRTGPVAGNEFPEEGDAGIKAIHVALVECVENIGLRYQEENNPQSWYWPKKPIVRNGEIFIEYNSTISEDLLYDPNMTVNNDLEVVIPFDTNEVFDTSFPYQIIRSKSSLVASDLNWREFPVNDIYELKRDKGEIMALESFDNINLYINTKNSLFITRADTKIGQGETEVVLGTGDIFALAPQEILDDDGGYLGCSHRNARIRTRYGYVFLDSYLGRIYLMVGRKPKEISAIGLRNFFRDNLYEANDNPFTSTGITLGYANERLVLAHPDFTASYSFPREGWSSFHDYKPNVLLSTRKDIYSTKNQKLHLNRGNGIGLFYGTSYDAYYDAILTFNSETKLVNIFWDVKGANYGQEYDLYSLQVFNDSHCSNLLLPTINNSKKAGSIKVSSQFFDYLTSSNFLGSIQEGMPIDQTKLSNVEDSRRIRGTYFIVRATFKKNTMTYLNSINANLNNLFI